MLARSARLPWATSWPRLPGCSLCVYAYMWGVPIIRAILAPKIRAILAPKIRVILGLYRGYIGF